jgi:hypothetical protein
VKPHQIEGRPFGADRPAGLNRGGRPFANKEGAGETIGTRPSPS